MTIIICPGVHSPELTQSFIQSMQNTIGQNCLILPTEQYPPYSAIAITDWLKLQQLSKTQSLSLIAFSAGVVGAIGAANIWQLQGGKVQSFIAFDGWGMPLAGDFPIYRVSHDYFTHYSSGILGAGESGFYAEPEVEHLELWRSPDTCWGWQIITSGLKARCFLTDYIQYILKS